MYVNPITRQIYDDATPITTDNNPRTFIQLDPDSKTIIQNIHLHVKQRNFCD